MADYPELAKYDKLMKLKKVELLFVWYFACELSPFHGIEVRADRVEKSLEMSFYKEEKDPLKQKKRAQWAAGSFDTVMSEAIEQMSAFKPGSRIQAKEMADKILRDYRYIILSEKIEDLKDGDKRKDYVAITKVISAALPALVEQTEGGYGITEEESNLHDGENFSDDFHNAE
jgi:hypothetical protein